MKVNRCVATVIVLMMVACGPKPPPEPPEPQGPSPEELAQERAEAEAPYHEAVQKFNESIWEVKPDLLHESLTEETYGLFMERSKKEAQLRDIEEEINDEWFLEQQQDYKIVYSIKSVNLDTNHAVIVGTIEGEVQWESEINFVEEEGTLRIDHSPVLEKAIDDLDTALEAKEERLEKEADIKMKVDVVVADHNTALADVNPEMFEATISAEMAELAVKMLGLLPKKKGGKKKPTMKKYVKYLTKRIEKVEVKEIDFDEMTVTLIHYPAPPKKAKKDAEPPKPFEKAVKLTEEGGRLLLDYSDFLKTKVEKLEAEAAEEEEGGKKGKKEKGEKKKKGKKKDE